MSVRVFRERSAGVSRVWAAAAVIACGLAVVTAAVAVVHQRAADRPIGEGELFLAEAVGVAAAIESGLAEGTSSDDLVRQIRNDLRIESVALIGADGMLEAATSTNLVGLPLHDPFLAFSIDSGRFGALADAIQAPLMIDGVAAWESGDVLYQVVYPLGEGRGVLLHYDVEELFARRASARGIQAATVQLAVVTAVLVLTAIALFWGRSSAVRRVALARREAEHHEERSAQLEEHNLVLDEARREAEAALALAEETNRVRTEFVLMINHELRTPLTSVVTGAELLQSGDHDPETQELLLTDMVKEGNRLRELISQMLVVARIENRGLDYTLRPTPVIDVLNALHEVTSAAQIDDEAGDMAEVTLSTDRAGLAQLLTSLAENAHTHGASSVTVSVSSTLPGDPAHSTGAVPAAAVHFLVTDDAPGIDPQFLPRIFEKFEKKSFSSGTGLGLYLARLMVEAIEGSISVIPRPAGTTFVVSVPIAEASGEVAA